ncbi:MAG: hypothetical protein ACRDP5_24110 [Streptosporangiaceae bacterium]
MRTWTAQSWLLAFVLAIAGFWPWWAFHSVAGTVAWLLFLAVLAIGLRRR